MDIATLVGIILGLGAIVGSIFLMTPDFGMFGSASSFGIVFGGMLASVAVAFPLKDVLQLGAAMAAVFKEQKAGASFDIFIGLPEEKRSGFLGLLEMKSIDSSPNEFVPAGTQLFQRWRIDIPTTWGNLEKLLNDTAPDIGSMVEFTVNLLGKDKDQNFDFKFIYQTS